MNGARKFIVLMAIIITASVAYYFFSTRRADGLELIGTVDSNQVIVSARTSGRIERLLVQDGTQVKQGDVIAVLDTAELEAQKRATEAALASLRSRVLGSRATEQSTRGTTSSDVLSAKSRAQMTSAQLAEAQADLERTESDTRRVVSLAEQGVASQQDRDRAEMTLKAAQARVQSLKDQVAAAESDMQAAQARTHQAHAAESDVASMRAQISQAQAQLAEAQTRLGYTQVLAPVSGTVSVRAAREGEVVNPGQPIVTIVDLSDTWVYAAIPETYADGIPLGDKLKVRMPSGNELQGEVTFKAAEGDFATQRDVSRRKRDIKTVGMKVRVDNSARALVPGMTATVIVPEARLGRK